MNETYTTHTALTLCILTGWGALTAIGAYAADRLQKATQKLKNRGT